MKTVFRSPVLMLALGVSAFVLSQAVPMEPVIELDIQQLLAPGEKNVTGSTLSFLSDKTLAIGGCGQERKHCKLLILALNDRGFHPIAETDNYLYGGSLFRSPDGGVISDRNAGAFRTASLYSPDLHQVHPLSNTTLSPHLISQSGKTFGQQFGRNRWEIYRTSASPERIRAGAGELLSVSDEAVVYQEQSAIRIDETNGTHLGSFLAKPASKCVTSAQIIGDTRVWVNSCGEEAICDFNGKIAARIRKPDGWGIRLGQSSEGSRVLYDRYTRKVSLTRRISEDAVAVGTLGLGVANEESNGELVRVIDMNSGNICFEWHQSNGTAEEGFYHADISPSGRSVAIITRTSLAIYELPLKCKIK
jgi:hypothetical protein